MLHSKSGVWRQRHQQRSHWVITEHVTECVQLLSRLHVKKDINQDNAPPSQPIIKQSSDKKEDQRLRVEILMYQLTLASDITALITNSSRNFSTQLQR